jgi:hypothetical protein
LGKKQCLKSTHFRWTLSKSLSTTSFRKWTQRRSTHTTSWDPVLTWTTNQPSPKNWSSGCHQQPKS